MNTLKKTFFLVIIGTVFLLACWGMNKLLESAKDHDQKVVMGIKNQGAAAYRAGVPANANPYNNSSYYYWASPWLDGWMGAKLAKENK